VNLDNLEEYLTLVVDATVKVGISAQIEAYRSGFNQVSPFFLWWGSLDYVCFVERDVRLPG
jgi:hypothetical protein